MKRHSFLVVVCSHGSLCWVSMVHKILLPVPWLPKARSEMERRPCSLLVLVDHLKFTSVCPFPRGGGKMDNFFSQDRCTERDLTSKGWFSQVKEKEEYSDRQNQGSSKKKQ